MKKNVTIQDIANELGLSRNTVSKALNNSSNIPESTKEKVLKKALEMNYKQFAYFDKENINPKNTGNIVLLAGSSPLDPWFWSYVLHGLEKKISDEGYTLSIIIVKPEDMSQLSLPSNFNKESVDGIICFEIFDKNYINEIASTNIPIVFIDTTADITYGKIVGDIVLMENDMSTYHLTNELIKRGHSKIGFIGEYTHCRGFFERWKGFKRALEDANIPLNYQYNITEENQPYDPTWIKQQLESFKELPTAFVCANDHIAIQVMQAIKSMSLNIPNDISICGFDDTSQSLIVDPPLTTVHIPKETLGLYAAEILFQRLRNPNRPFQITYIQTEVKVRDSIGKSKQ